jgi:hypothetical protein
MIDTRPDLRHDAVMAGDEKENEAKLVALRATIAAGIASGSEDSDVVFAELDEFISELVAQPTQGRRILIAI